LRLILGDRGIYFEVNIRGYGGGGYILRLILGDRRIYFEVNIRG
jgi:hypothetical protein